MAGNGAEGDDAAAAAFAHLRQDRLHHVGGTEIVDPEQALHARVGVIDQLVAGHQRCRVYQQVDGPQGLLHLRDFRLHLRQVADIAVEGADVVVPGCRGLQALFVDVKDGDSRTPACQSQSDDTAHATGAAGDQGDLVIHCLHARAPLVFIR